MSEQITQELLDATARIAPATVGHFIEQGVVDPEIRAIVRPAGFVGRAATVRTVVPDSALVHHAVSSLQRHDVLVIDCGGARRHAPVGEVVALAAQIREAAAIVIDGPCTDALENLNLRAADIGEYKSYPTERSRSHKTTKLGL